MFTQSDQHAARGKVNHSFWGGWKDAREREREEKKGDQRKYIK